MYPVLFARNVGTSTISVSSETFGGKLSVEIFPGEIEEVPYLLAATSEFNRVLAAGDVELSETFDFAVVLDALPELPFANPATTEVGGLVKAAASQPDSEATTIAALRTDFNTLLANLRTAGIVATPE